MENRYIYLDTYVLQQDMRIRLPKSILGNLNTIKGQSHFDIYLDKANNSIILKLSDKDTSSNEKRK